MKITYFANARIPNEKAHGIQLIKTIESFVHKGIDVSLVIPTKKNSLQENTFEYYGLSVQFPIKKLRTFSLFPKSSLGFILASFSFALSSFVYIVWNKPKGIFYSIDLDPISFLGIIFFKNPVFFEMHAPKSRTFLNRILFKRARGVIAINERVKRELIETFPALHNKVLVCPNGVDIQKYEKINTNDARKKLNLPLDKKAVVYTGSFQDWKGIETIIQTATKLPHILFYIAGGTKKELDNLGVKDIPSNVRIIGKVNFKDIPLWQKSADVLLLAGTQKDTYSYLHTSPMKLFEYMAAQKPIVSSRTPAITQIVSDKEVFFHEPDNPEDLEHAINQAFAEDSTERLRRLFELAEKYSWESRAQKILNFVQTKI